MSHNIKTNDDEVNITNFLVAMAHILKVGIYFIRQQVNSQFLKLTWWKQEKLMSVKDLVILWKVGQNVSEIVGLVGRYYYAVVNTY